LQPHLTLFYFFYFALALAPVPRVPLPFLLFALAFRFFAIANCSIVAIASLRRLVRRQLSCSGVAKIPKLHGRYYFFLRLFLAPVPPVRLAAFFLFFAIAPSSKMLSL
jgi:hypothetical protein